MGSGNEESDGNLLQQYTDSLNTSSSKPLHITMQYTIRYIQKGKHMIILLMMRVIRMRVYEYNKDQMEDNLGMLLVKTGTKYQKGWRSVYSS